LHHDEYIEMNISSSDRIEIRIELKAAPARVWRALTDYREFGEWFGVKLESPFVPGTSARGAITYPGYEHLAMEIAVQKMEPMWLFSFHWHPYAVDPSVDYSKEPPTLVEFHVEQIASGTLLVVTESGFDSIPAARRDQAFRMNRDGWAEQMKNIQKYIVERP
jgi:uncharacterized protein YndB with AHSA1/START domain